MTETKKLTVEAFLALPDDEKSAMVYEKIFGGNLLTYDEMLKIAECVWITQPSARAFLDGFYVCGFGHDGKPVFKQQIKNYAADISAAWEVAEKIKLLPYWPSDAKSGPISELRIWWSENTLWNCRTWGEDFHEGEAETAPLAICICALKAVGAIR